MIGVAAFGGWRVWSLGADVSAIEERLARVETQVAFLIEQVGYEGPGGGIKGLGSDVRALEKCLKAVMEAVAYNHKMASQFSVLVGDFLPPFSKPGYLAFYEACPYTVFSKYK